LETVEVAGPELVDVEGGSLLEAPVVSGDGTPLLLAGDEVSCGEDEALRRKGIN
jgi:hypothetical protein